MFGLILIIVGILLLFQQFGWITGDFWGYLWPAILIIFGFSIWSRKGGNNWCCGFKHQEKKKPNIVDEQ